MEQQTYAAWRISFQSSEQAAKSAFNQLTELQSKLSEQEPVGWNVIYIITVVEEKLSTETMLSRKGKLPFFPVIGMSIDTGEGNPRVINDVLWRADVSELAVTFEDEDGYTLKTLKKWGWLVHE